MRECGACNLCCKVIGAPPDSDAFIGPAGQWCEHCDVGVGCRIHESRPERCRTWTCMWLGGSMTEKHRPDKIGVVFWQGAKATVTFTDGRVVSPVRANESYRGAAKRKRAKRIIDALVEAGVPVLVEFEGERTFLEPQIA